MRYKAIPILIFLLFSPTLLPSVYPPQIGGKTPGFITSTLDGKGSVLKDYWDEQGNKALVRSFFAMWCQPCKEDLPYLQKVQDQYGNIGLQIPAVRTQDSSKENVVKEFTEKLGVKLPVLLDEYRIIGKRYAPTALPCNFVADKGGILRAN